MPDQRPAWAPPNDVWEWVCDTYTVEGRRIWLEAFHEAEDPERERMIAAARTDPMGT